MFRNGILMLSPFGTYRNVPAVKKALFRAANLSSSGGIAFVSRLVSLPDEVGDLVRYRF